uniref:Replication-associated protein n=1 Tax=Giant panda feces-associated gemycircularvirus TaxID=2864014 RepID=A0A8K1HH33_9VIRU|nr:replication-associated protein [Giant panda feces-associated gemycircularvirus]
MFYCNSKYVLLTFAQCGDLDEWSVNDHLSTLGAECIIAREVHPETGGVHLHVFVDFGRKFRSRNVRVFDVDGRHPNVSPSRGTPEKGYDYAIKDGDVVAGGLGRPRPRGGMHVGAHSVRNIKDLCENAGEFLEVFDELDPGTMFKCFSNIRSYADWKFAPEPEIYVPPFGTAWGCDGTDGRSEWFLQSGIGTGGVRVGELPLRSAFHIFCFLFRVLLWGRAIPLPSAGPLGGAHWTDVYLGERPKSLVLYGPSRTGKTSWARSLGRHAYFERLFSGKEALAEMADAKYAVFDDCSIDHMPGWKSWFGAQMTVGVRPLYRDAVYVRWGKPIIWCCNRDPRIDMRNDIDNERSHKWYQDDIDWIEANCIFVHVAEPIFHANRE